MQALGQDAHLVSSSLRTMFAPRLTPLLSFVPNPLCHADSKGRTVDFKNTLIILTSNVGSSVIEKGGGGIGFQVRPCAC